VSGGNASSLAVDLFGSINVGSRAASRNLPALRTFHQITPEVARRTRKQDCNHGQRGSTATSVPAGKTLSGREGARRRDHFEHSGQAMDFHRWPRRRGASGLDLEPFSLSWAEQRRQCPTF
jgi:hypothetical protein